MLDNEGQPVTDWAEIKKLEKTGREWEEEYLLAALEEGRSFIEQAAKRKGLSVQ